MDLATALELLQIDSSEAHPSEDEVRAAYKAQALLWHPDKNADRVEVHTEQKPPFVSIGASGVAQLP